jgi:hypothetical protein
MSELSKTQKTATTASWTVSRQGPRGANERGDAVDGSIVRGDGNGLGMAGYSARCRRKVRARQRQSLVRGVGVTGKD